MGLGFCWAVLARIFLARLLSSRFGGAVGLRQEAAKFSRVVATLGWSGPQRFSDIAS